MLSNESNTSQGFAGWVKGLIGVAVALIAAGGSLVAILDYLRIEPVPSPTSNPATVIVVTESQPVPAAAQTGLPPAVVYEPVFQTPDPVVFILSYWSNINEGRFESAWEQLSPDFRQARHNNNYAYYVQGYQDMKLCRIDISNPFVVQQEEYSAIVQAHFTYYTGIQCKSSEYDFEMWLVYDHSTNSWLFDRNIMK